MTVKKSSKSNPAYRLGSPEFHGYRERMTNWQYHQWVRAKRPTDRNALERFVNLVHWKRAAREAAA